MLWGIKPISPSRGQMGQNDQSTLHKMNCSMNILFALHNTSGGVGNAFDAGEIAEEKGHKVAHGLGDKKENLEFWIKKENINVLILWLKRDTPEYIEFVRSINPDIRIVGVNPMWFPGHEIPYSYFFDAGINACIDLNQLYSPEKYLE